MYTTSIIEFSVGEELMWLIMGSGPHYFWNLHVDSVAKVGLRSLNPNFLVLL